jgi:Bacterial Ig domain
VDALAALTKSPSFPPAGDVIPRTVAFAFPPDAWIVDQNAAVTVKVEASNNHALLVVEFRIDSRLVASSDTSPLVYKWPRANGRLASGTYTLNARAIDQAGHAVSTGITVTKP